MTRPGALRVMLIAVLGLLTFLPIGADADQWNWGVSYGFSAPVGNTREFTDDFSWRNVGLEVRRIMEEENLSLGFAAAWNVFFDEGLRTTQLPGVNGTLHGYQYRYTNAFPLYLNGHYYFGKAYGPRPFVGLNLGTIIMDERLEVGLIVANETNWHLAGAPEIGIVIPRGNNTVFLNARYNVAGSAGSFPNQSYFSVSLGIAGS